MRLLFLNVPPVLMLFWYRPGKKGCEMKKNDSTNHLFVDPEDEGVPDEALIYKMSRRYRKNRRQLARILVRLWSPYDSETLFLSES